MDKGTILRKALLIRRVEERLFSLFSERRIHGSFHTCIGQELTPALLEPLLSEQDFAGVDNEVKWLLRSKVKFAHW